MPERPTVIDLFAGVGGLSLGAARAGFEVLAAVENDPIALASHTKNFPNVEHFSDDIRKLKGKTLLKRLGMQVGELTGLIGGPPCQGFSNIGRRDGRDGRNHLFGHFFRLVNEIRPAFFVAENVPGILNAKYELMRANAMAKIPDDYVLLDPLPVKASDYGAPTIRTRVFFFGYDPSRFRMMLQTSDFAAPKNAENITVQMALLGLPVQISDDWQAENAEWLEVVKKSGTRFMGKITGKIPKGIGHQETIKKYKKNALVSGCQGTRHLPAVVKRFAEVEPGNQDEISRAVRLKGNGHCPTLRAGTGRDKGSYQAIRPIHFSEARVITPREAARLQGFPDWFVFHPTKWHSFRQIGNSVSPIIAEYIMTKIKKSMQS